MLAFDQAAVRALVAHRHAQLSESHMLPSPAAVAANARNLVDPTHPAIEIDNAPAVAYWSGLTLYSVAYYGLSAEDLCDLTSYAVMQSVVVLSPDRRLLHTKRLDEQRSRLTQADNITQLVKLGEIRAWVTLLQDRRKRSDRLQVAEGCRQLALAELSMLSALGKLLDDELHLKLQAELTAALVDLADIKTWERRQR